MPRSCRTCASISPAGPAPTIPTCVSISADPRRRRCGRPSRLEEDRLVLALQADVERVGTVAGAVRNQGLARLLGHERQDRVAGVAGLVLEIDAREQAPQDATGEDADVNVRRLHGAIGARYRAGLHGLEEEAPFRIAMRAAEALELRIRQGGVGAGIAPLPVRLPDLDHGVGDG